MRMIQWIMRFKPNVMGRNSVTDWTRTISVIQKTVGKHARITLPHATIFLFYKIMRLFWQIHCDMKDLVVSRVVQTLLFRRVVVLFCKWQDCAWLCRSRHSLCTEHGRYEQNISDTFITIIGVEWEALWAEYQKRLFCSEKFELHIFRLRLTQLEVIKFHVKAFNRTWHM